MTQTQNPLEYLSPKLVALLRHAKRNHPTGEALGIQSIKETLSDLYHPSMSSRDAVRLMLLSMEELRSEPRFEVFRAPDWWIKLMLAPVSLGWLYDKAETMLTIDQFYERVVAECWATLLLTRVDWCLSELQPEAKVLSSKEGD
jgi:hypothetical protein